MSDLTDGIPPGPTAKRRREFFWKNVVPLRGAVVVLLGGEIDMRTVDQFEEAVEAAFAVHDVAVILDISRVEFFAAAGTHVLAKAQRLATDTGRDLRVVVDEQRLLIRVLRVAGLTGELALFHDLDAAVNATGSTGETVDFDGMRRS